MREGRKLLSFSCNDYLNLTQHPAIVAAATEALHRYGIGAGASRLVTGNHPLYAELESAARRAQGTEAACVFGSGYLANTGIIPALIGPDDLILIDELSHACIHAGAKMSGAASHRYRHDASHMRECAAGSGNRAPSSAPDGLATDGVFSMDGDLAPLEGTFCAGAGVRRMVAFRRRARRRRFGNGRGSNFVDGGTRRSAANGDAVKGDRRIRRLSLRLAAGH